MIEIQRETHRDRYGEKFYSYLWEKLENLKVSFDASTIINCEHSYNYCGLKMRVILKEIEK